MALFATQDASELGDILVRALRQGGGCTGGAMPGGRLVGGTFRKRMHLNAPQRRDVPWETYMTARLITEKDLQLIRRYDKRSEELRGSMLDEVGGRGSRVPLED
jgi:hypothetical protein